MILSAKAVTLASLNRDFSLGGHVRLDGKRKKIFSNPYSTLILMNASSKLNVEKIKRERTNFKTVLKYKIKELYRLYNAKFVRILPDFLKDRIIENKYKKILGSKAKSIEIQAGSLEAAPAEINRWSMDAETLKVRIKLFRDKKSFEVEYIYKKKFLDERPMVLDVLLQAQEEKIDDLSFRYGCRARNCGVCTVDINGKPRLACRARVKADDLISPLSTLPVIKI